MTIKTIIAFILSFNLTFCNFLPNYPDAIRCGMTGVEGEANILFMHGGNLGSAMYCQIYSGEARCVTFVDGKYSTSTGHQGTIGWCVNKTIDDLAKNKRAWSFA